MKEMFKGIDFFYYQRYDNEYLIIDFDDIFISIQEYVDENDDYDYGIADWKIYDHPFAEWEKGRSLNDSDFFWGTIKDNWPTFYRMIVDIIFEGPWKS